MAKNALNPPLILYVLRLNFTKDEESHWLYYVGHHFCNLQAFISYLPTSNNGAPEDKILSVFSCSTKHFNSSGVTVSVSVLCYCYDSADLPFGAATQFHIQVGNA